jgi:hypothetical protein
MLQIAIITGCRKTFSKLDKDFPCYIKQTIQSIEESDIPKDLVTIYVDTLQETNLDLDYIKCLDSINYKKVYNYGGGIINNVKEVFQANQHNLEEYLLLLEDDVEVNPNIYQETLNFIGQNKPNFATLYNVYGQDVAEVPINGFWGGQAIIMKTKDLNFYADNLGGEYVGYPDIQLSRLAGFKLNYKLLVKGLVQHIGKISAHNNEYHNTNIY